MIEEQAIVVRVEGDRAYLEVERHQPCGLCGATRGCGVSIWGRLFASRHGSISLPNSLQLGIGDRVVVAVQEGALLHGALLTYLMPLLLVCLGGFFGAMMGGSRGTSDLYGVLGAVTGLLLGLVVVRRAGPAAGRQPTMLRRADSLVIRQCSR